MATQRLFDWRVEAIIPQRHRKARGSSDSVNRLLIEGRTELRSIPIRPLRSRTATSPVHVMFRDHIIRISGAVVRVTRPGILTRMIHPVCFPKRSMPLGYSHAGSPAKVPMPGTGEVCGAMLRLQNALTYASLVLSCKSYHRMGTVKAK
jgi:hypothetical protein